MEFSVRPALDFFPSGMGAKNRTSCAQRSRLPFVLGGVAVSFWVAPTLGIGMATLGAGYFLTNRCKKIPKVNSDHQKRLHTEIQSVPLDPNLWNVGEDRSNQVSIGKIIQTIVLRFYKEPMPQISTAWNPSKARRLMVNWERSERYQDHVAAVVRTVEPARGTHGTMHCVRVTLLTQLLSRVYERLGRKKAENPILLATTGALHDAAREYDFKDRWDAESAEIVERLFSRLGLDPKQIEHYVQAIRDKDPLFMYSSDDQRKVHDADCLEIMRLTGKKEFIRSKLSFYHFDKSKKEWCDKLIDEVGDFIELSEDIRLKNHLEHHSQDFYGDLVRLLFSMKDKFPLVTQLLQGDMEDILKGPDNSQQLREMISTR